MYSGRLPKKPFINLCFFVVKDQFGQLHNTCHGNILQNKGGDTRDTGSRFGFKSFFNFKC